MLTMGMSAADQRAFEATLLGDHQTRVLVQVLDTDHNVVGEASDAVLSGQVDVDATADVTRTCQMEIHDPDYALHLDSGAGPAEAAMYADRMIQVHYCVRSDALPRWVNVPVFTGPITSLKRSRDTLSLDAKGKESLLSVQQSRHWDFRAGTVKTDAIKRILNDCGEQFYGIPHWSSRMAAPISITGRDAPWPVMKQLAASLASRSAGTDPVLFYNGDGYCRLKSFNHASRWTFRRSVDFMTEPDLSFDVESLRNYVAAHGANNVYGTAKLPDSDPLSAKSLGRHGIRRWLAEHIDNDQWTTKAACTQAARNYLAQSRRLSVAMDLETVCIPHLEERDVVGVDNGTWSWRMQLTKFSIPLDGSSTMQIGRTSTTRRVTRHTPLKRRKWQ